MKKIYTAEEFIKSDGTGGFLKTDGSEDTTVYEAALGYTPENVANKSDSYTVSSSTTYASTKALVDGLAVKNWIKSNEPLSLAQRKNDVLYGILDQYTGEEITLSKVTGTPTVDNVIYFQLGAEYFKRNYTKIFPEWFGAAGDGVTDDTAEIQSAINIQNGIVFLSEKTYVVSNLRIKFGTVLKGSGTEKTKIKQGSTSNYAINCLSDGDTGILRGIELLDFSVIGATSATVAAVNVEAYGIFAVQNSTFNFNATDTYSALRAVCSSANNIYNCNFKVVSSGSQEKIYTSGGYNIYDFFIVNSASGYYLEDTSSQSVFKKIVTTGSSLFAGANNTIVHFVCEDFVGDEASYSSVLAITGHGQTFNEIVITNIPNAKASLSIDIYGKNTNIQSVILQGTTGVTATTYPMGMSSESSGIVGNFISKSTYKLDQYITAATFQNWRFVGICDSLLQKSTNKDASYPFYTDNALTGETITGNSWRNGVIFDNASVLATQTILLPESPPTGYVYYIMCRNQGITTLTVTPFAGSTISDAPTSLSKGDSYGFIYNDLKWTRLYMSKLDSTEFTGTPTAPTATAGTNTTQIATTAFVQANSSSGTYTPTLTNTTNISSSALNAAYYVRNGNLVTVTIAVQITLTATADTVLTFSLPVSGATAVNGIGQGNLTSGGGAVNAYGIVDTTNSTTAQLRIGSTAVVGSGAGVANIIFTYSL